MQETDSLLYKWMDKMILFLILFPIRKSEKSIMGESDDLKEDAGCKATQSLHM